MALLALVASTFAQTPTVSETAPAGAAAAEVAPCTVMTPILTVDTLPRDVGLMFATQVGSKRVLVTAQSLFGPAGGFAAPIPATDLATRVQRVEVRDAYDTRVSCGFSTEVLPVPDAVPMGGLNDGSKDVAVFAVGVPTKKSELKKASSSPALVLLPFAASPPAVGDVVHVLAPHVGQTERLSSGKVVEAGNGALYFQYDDPMLNVSGTVGAPVVNADQQVVGVNLGAGKMDDGALIGAATPLEPIRERVQQAAR